MIKSFIDFVFKIVLLSVLLVSLHYFVFQNTIFSIDNDLIQKFYFFLISLNIFTYYILLKISEKKPDFVGYTFLGFVLIKMVVSFVFLYPTIQSNILDKEMFILVFFGLYFIYLIFETVLSVTLINKKNY